MAKIFSVDFRKGGYLDTVSGSYGTPVDAKFAYGSKGVGAEFNGTTSSITYPGATLSKLSSTFVAWVHFRSIQPLTRIIMSNGINQQTRIGANISGWTCESNTNSDFWISQGFQDVGNPLQGPLCIIMSADSSFVSFWVNGIFGETLSVIDDLTLSVVGQEVNEFFDGLIYKIEMYDTSFTEQERNKEFSEFFNSHPTIETKRKFYYPKPTDLSNEEGIVAAYNMVPSSGELTDISGNTETGIVVGPLSTYNGMKFNGVSDYVYSNNEITSASITGDLSFAVSFLQYENVSEQIIFASGIASADRIGVSILGGLFGFVGWDGVFQRERANLPLSINQRHDCVVTRTSGGSYVFYIDGIVVAGVASTAVAPGSSDWAIGKRNGVDTQYFNGEIYDIRVYNRILSADEAIAYHNQFASEVVYRNSFEDYAVGKLPVSWRTGSGTWDIVEDLYGKYLLNTVIGSISTPSQNAYGTWEFDIFSPGTGDAAFYFMSSTSDLSTASGYAIRILSNERIYLIKIVNGGTSNLGGSVFNLIVPLEWYRIKVTRDFQGLMSFYIKGGSYGDNYLLVPAISGSNPVTDTANTVSQFMLVDAASDYRFKDIVHRKGIEQ